MSLARTSPVFPGAGPNLFSYSLGSPAVLADPDGLGVGGRVVCVAAQAANAASTIAEINKLDEQLEKLEEELEKADEICFPDEESEFEYKAEIWKEIARVTAARTASLAKGSMIALGVGAVCVPLVAGPF